MGLTFTHSQHNGYYLDQPSENPVSVVSGVTIGNHGVNAFAGLSASASIEWQITNSGSLFGNWGVYLAGGGSVANTGSNALISGEMYGVQFLGGDASVTNAASIIGKQSYSESFGPGNTLTSSRGVGVDMYAGGVVRNTNPDSSIVGGGFGVRVQVGAGTVTNIGTITSYSYYKRGRANSAYYTVGFKGIGVALQGGTVVNGGFLATQATIKGGLGGVSITNSAGVVDNYGTITAPHTINYGYYAATYASGVSLSAGGAVVNGDSSVPFGIIVGSGWGVAISGGAGTVANFGSISGGSFGYFGWGVSLAAGGTVTNGGQSSVTGASIVGGNAGVLISGQPGFIANYGTIESSYYTGSDVFAATGVHLAAGGRVVNGSTVVTSARIGGIASGVLIEGGTGTVGNDGTIAATYPGSGGIGVRLTAGGRVNNGANGAVKATITAAAAGVAISGGAARVINSGTISGSVGVLIDTGVGTATVTDRGTITGTGGTAINFGSASSLLQLYGGAVLHGTVKASAAEPNVIELSGSAHGTISNIGGSFVGFRSVNVDAGAYWTLGGTNTASSAFGVTLNASSELALTGTLALADSLSLVGTGSLVIDGKATVGAAGTGASNAFTVDSGAGGTVSGSGLIAAATIVDNGLILATQGTLLLDSYVGGAGIVQINPGAVLSVAESLAGVSVTFLSGGNSTLELDAPGLASSVISGFAHGDKIDLLGTMATAATFSQSTHVLTVTGAGGTAARLHFSGSYTGQTFHVAGDGHHGTNITVS